jgi:hypothetical protein
MEDEKYNEQFKALTNGLEFEKIYDALAERADFVRKLTQHCGEIYKAARSAGLPRGVAEQMAMGYFKYEITPSTGMYVIEDGEGEGL